MKKTLLSVIIASAASSVSAVEVYNENGTTVNLNGEVKGVYERFDLKKSSSDIFKKRYGHTMDRNGVTPSGSLTLSSTIELGTDTKGFASFKIEGDTSTKTKDPVFKGDFQNKTYNPFAIHSKGSYERKEEVSISDFLVGIQSGAGTLSLGQTDSSMDILGSAKMTNQLELTYDSFTDANEGRGVRYEHVFNDATVSIDYQDFEELKNGENYVSTSFTQKMDDLKIGATYTHVTEGAHKGSVAGFMMGYENEGFELVTTFARFKGYKLPVICDLNMDRIVTDDKETKTLYAYFDASLLTVGTSYRIDKVRLYSAFQHAKSKRFAFNEWNKDGIAMTYNTYQLGAEYNMSTNFKLFAESTIEDSDWGSIKTGRKEFALGAVYQF